jgi:hypothetical protein
VENCAVLDVNLVADPDRVHIAPDDSVEPYTTVISNDYIAHDRCIGGDKAVFAELGKDTFYGQNYRHLFLILTQTK